MVKIDPAFTQLFPAGLQFLGQPMTAVRPLQRIGNVLWMHQHLAQVLPDPFVELVGRNEARRALALPSRVSGRRFTPADVVIIARRARSAKAGQPAAPAADQGAPQIRVCLVVAPRELTVLQELGLHLVESLLGDDGWDHGHRQPLLGRCRSVAAG